MNIFYSWQSDTPNAIGKNFIRLALDAAVSEVSESMSLEEAERPTIDQDTQGIMGTPPIAETIFEKIRNANIIAVDVTLVGKTLQDKKLINSNVAYELGYAHAHHGDSVLLTVMNMHYGTPNDLPFDLKHRRWPVCYTLSPEATQDTRRKERQSLATKLTEILTLYIGKQPKKDRYEPRPSTLNPACYWDDNENIVKTSNTNDDGGSLALGFTGTQPLTYLRIWPDEPMKSLTGVELSDYQISAIQPLLGRALGFSNCRNKYGTIAYSGQNAGVLIAITQLFKNREIWGVEGYILRPREGNEPNIVSSFSLEEGLTLSLNTYLKVAFDHLNYTNRVHVEAGLVNIEGFKLVVKDDFRGRYFGPIFEDITVKCTVNKGDQDSIDKALRQIFEKVYDAAGVERL